MGKWSACQLPRFNPFLAEHGFRTDLHVDDHNLNMVASVCEGRKRWRIVKPKDWAMHWKDFGVNFEEPGINISSGRFIFGDLPRPFETWTESSKLHSMDIVVYESVLEPGEVLYIPAGAPHAAHTMSNTFMVSAHDRSMQESEDFVKACALAKKQKIHQLRDKCWEELTAIRSGLRSLKANWAAHGSDAVASTKTWMDTYRCQASYCNTVKPRMEKQFYCQGGTVNRRQRRQRKEL
eukprot:gnl/TRDRNA2_/TRDRNA2_157642_c0_seq2.p1 gnl/TRDRNA2_/TRDRNA2_157642_c0~~gnl/TRDRNA2_/TRDRNA2_157642_c0_seq2.p1  ORF type:complete len:236 (+),score=22.48 gnl/TRDRNA2_/TRDRNA2_157642_c0_seq2:184-891(+)